MQRYTTLLVTFVLLFSGVAMTAAHATDADDQQQLVKKFFTAYFTNDYKTVRECLPGKQDLMFNAYPFTKAPTLSAPSCAQKAGPSSSSTVRSPIISSLPKAAHRLL